MQKYPYQDKNLSVSERAEDLLNRMAVQQKIAQPQCVRSIGAELDAEDFPDGLGEANIGILGMPREQQAEIIDANAKQLRKMH